MKKKVFIGMLLGCVGVLTACGNNQPQPVVINDEIYSPDNTITVTGKGKSKMKADTGYLFVDVSVEKKMSKDAQEMAADTMDEIYSTLRRIGIKDKDIETTNYSVEMLRDYSKQKSPYPITGYKVSNSIKITIKDTSKISDVIDNVAGSPYVSVNSLKFDLLDKEQAETEAIVDATDSAKKRAKVIAKKLGVKLSGVKSVEVVATQNKNYENSPIPYQDEMYLKEISSDTPVSVKNIETETSVEVKFLVKD